MKFVVFLEGMIVNLLVVLIVVKELKKEIFLYIKKFEIFKLLFKILECMIYILEIGIDFIFIDDMYNVLLFFMKNVINYFDGI